VTAVQLKGVSVEAKKKLTHEHVISLGRYVKCRPSLLEMEDQIRFNSRVQQAEQLEILIRRVKSIERCR